MSDINAEGRFLGETRNDGKDMKLLREDYPFSANVKNTMARKFGIHSYRPNQLQAINSAMLGHDTYVDDWTKVFLFSNSSLVGLS